jgi:hypothetical protein
LELFFDNVINIAMFSYVGVLFPALVFAQNSGINKEAGNFTATSSVQKTAESKIKGTVKQIAADSTYIIVDGTKIFTTKEFLEDSYVEVGDKVEITIEKTEMGLKATSYDYVFDDEEDNQTGTLNSDVSDKDNAANLTAPGNATNDSDE